MKMRQRMLALAASAAIATAALTGCGDNRDQFVITNGNNGIIPIENVLPPVGPQNVFALVANNGDGNRGQLDVFDRIFNLVFTGNSGNNQGIDVDSLLNVYQAGDVNATTDPGSVRIFGRLLERAEANNVSFNTTFDRLLGGAGTTNTGLVNPKGFEIAQAAGLMIVADFGDNNLKVFGTAAGGDSAPLATVELTEAPWDVAYDPGDDRLFVATTSGNVFVMDNFIANNFPNTPNRTITPSVVASNDVRNLHGIEYDAGRDALIVSDVGAATANEAADFATDGRIYILSNASTASGTVLPTKVLQGPNTLLGNPVDIDLNGTDLRVAEKAGDKLLIFPNIFDAPGGDFQPTVAKDESKPEALKTFSPNFVAPVDSSDQDALTVFTGVLATSNEAPADNVLGDEIVRFSPNLAAQQGNFNIPQDVESAAIDARGDVYVSYDVGIAVLNRVATSRDDGDFTTSRDRVIEGANTGLVAPKGLEIVDGRNWVIVSDFGTQADGSDASIRVFSKEAGGNVAPIFTTDTDGSRPWDADYDPASDTLFVAFTDGTIGVYDDFSTDGATATAPDRIITPVDAGNAQISTNLHGIVFDAVNNVLIVSDVGAASGGGSDTDGSLYVFNSALTASGNVQPTRLIEGAATLLGNPVDIAYDGTNLYVAEKANGGGQILLFNAIRTVGGGDPNTAPNASVNFAAAESVSINTIAPFTP